MTPKDKDQAASLEEQGANAFAAHEPCRHYWPAAKQAGWHQASATWSAAFTLDAEREARELHPEEYKLDAVPFIFRR